MIILGIETACDDTACAVVVDGQEVLSNVIASQHFVHARHRGIVPELAARQHTHQIMPTIWQALKTANLTLSNINAIAVNNQRGLLRSVAVGVAAAKGLAVATGKPLYAVHHVEGHIYSPLMSQPEWIFPHVCLTVAGGHNYLVLVEGIGSYRLLGATRDDAAGEALDKVAMMLGLGFPGGAALEQLAQGGDAKRWSLPRPLMESNDYSFSFSGLKTAARRIIESMSAEQLNLAKADLAASVQAAVVEVLCAKAARAIGEYGVRAVTLAGGVAANQCLRQSMASLAAGQGVRLMVAQKRFCTDNAAMIAALAYHYHLAGHSANLDCEIFPDAALTSWA